MCIDIRLRRSPCNPHNLSFRKGGGKVLRNYTGAGRACRVVIGAKMAALANDASSGRAGADGRAGYSHLNDLRTKMNSRRRPRPSLPLSSSWTAHAR